MRSLLALDEDGLREHKKHLAEMRESLKAAGERLAQGGKGAARQAFGLLAEDLQDLWYATSRCSNTKEDIENFILNEVSQKVDKKSRTALPRYGSRQQEVHFTAFLLSKSHDMKPT